MFWGESGQHVANVGLQLRVAGSRHRGEVFGGGRPVAAAGVGMTDGVPDRDRSGPAVERARFLQRSKGAQDRDESAKTARNESPSALGRGSAVSDKAPRDAYRHALCCVAAATLPMGTLADFGGDRPMQAPSSCFVNEQH